MAEAEHDFSEYCENSQLEQFHEDHGEEESSNQAEQSAQHAEHSAVQQNAAQQPSETSQMIAMLTAQLNNQSLLIQQLLQNQQGQQQHTLSRPKSYVIDTQWYNSKWSYNVVWDPVLTGQSYREWRTLWKLEVQRACGDDLYWVQLRGLKTFEQMDPATEQIHFGARSKQMLSQLLHCMQKVDEFRLIADIEYEADKFSGAERAFHLLEEKLLLMNLAERTQLTWQLSDISQTGDLESYCSLGVHYEKELLRDPSIMQHDMFCLLWVRGLSPTMEHMKMSISEKITDWSAGNIKFNIPLIVDRMKTLDHATKQGYFVPRKVYVNGKDITNSTLNPRDLIRTNAADIDINAAEVPHKDKRRKPKRKGVLVPCDNKWCNKQSSHGAAFCMFYTGAKEGQIPSTFSQNAKKGILAKIARDKALDKAGKGPETHSSALMTSNKPVSTQDIALSDQQQTKSIIELMYNKHGVEYMVAQLKSVHEKQTEGVDSNNIEIVDTLNNSVMSHQGIVTYMQSSCVEFNVSQVSKSRQVIFSDEQKYDRGISATPKLADTGAQFTILNVDLDNPNADCNLFFDKDTFQYFPSGRFKVKGALDASGGEIVGIGQAHGFCPKSNKRISIPLCMACVDIRKPVIGTHNLEWYDVDKTMDTGVDIDFKHGTISMNDEFQMHIRSESRLNYLDLIPDGTGLPVRSAATTNTMLHNVQGDIGVTNTELFDSLDACINAPSRKLPDVFSELDELCSHADGSSHADGMCFEDDFRFLEEQQQQLTVAAVSEFSGDIDQIMSTDQLLKQYPEDFDQLLSTAGLDMLLPTTSNPDAAPSIDQSKHTGQQEVDTEEIFSELDSLCVSNSIQPNELPFGSGRKNVNMSRSQEPLDFSESYSSCASSLKSNSSGDSPLSKLIEKKITKIKSCDNLRCNKSPDVDKVLAMVKAAIARTRKVVQAVAVAIKNSKLGTRDEFLHGPNEFLMELEECVHGTDLTDVEYFHSEFSMQTDVVQSFMTAITQHDNATPWQRLHERCAHISLRKIQDTVAKGYITDLDDDMSKCLQYYRRLSRKPKASSLDMVMHASNCLCCIRGKSKHQQLRPKKAENRELTKLQQCINKGRQNRTSRFVFGHWNADWKVFTTLQHDKCVGCIFHVDTVSSWLELGTATSRDQWVDEAQRVHAKSVVQLAELRDRGLTCNISPPKYTTDNDKAIVNAKFKKFAANWGMEIDLSAEYTADENIKAERVIGTVHSHALAIIADSAAPMMFLGDAYFNFKYAYLRFSHRGNKDNKSPYQIVHGKPASAHGVQRFMCLGAAHVEKKLRSNHGHQASFWVWVLYRVEGTSTYKVWKDTDLALGKTKLTFYKTKHVTIVQSICYRDRCSVTIPGYYDCSIPQSVIELKGNGHLQYEREEDMLPGFSNQDMDKAMEDELEQKAAALQQSDPRYQVGSVRETFVTVPIAGRQKTRVPCTNPYCKNPSSHETHKCFSYKGAVPNRNNNTKEDTSWINQQLQSLTSDTPVQQNILKPNPAAPPPPVPMAPPLAVAVTTRGGRTVKQPTNFDPGKPNKVGVFQPGVCETNYSISDPRVTPAERAARETRALFERKQREVVLGREQRRQHANSVAIKKCLRRVGQFADLENDETEHQIEAFSVALGKVTFEEMTKYGVPRHSSQIKKMPKLVRDQWKESDWAEYRMLRDTYKAVHEYPDTTDLQGESLYECMTVYKLEAGTIRYDLGRTKSRAVVVGTALKLWLDIAKLHASTGKIASLRFVISFGIQLGLRFTKLDMANCYINFIRSKAFWMKMLPTLRYDIPNTILKVTGNLYGAPDASRIAEEGIAHELEVFQGFTRCVEADYALYVCFRRVPDADAYRTVGSKDGHSGAFCCFWTHSDDFVGMDQYDTKLLDGIVKDINSEYTHPVHGYHKALPLQFDGEVSTSLPEMTVVGFQFLFEFDKQGHPCKVLMHCKKYKTKCAKRWFDTTPQEINGCETPMIPKSHISLADCPDSDELKAEVKREFSGNFFEFAGGLLFGAHGCGPQYLAGLSQLQRVSQNPSKEAWRAMLRLVKTWLSDFSGGVTAVRQTDPFKINRFFSSFDAAFAGNKEVTEYLVNKDMSVAYPRIGGVIQLNQMPVVIFTYRYKAVLDNTAAAETAALHHGVMRTNWLLKLVSYFTPVDCEWEHTPPHAFDGCEMLSEQDNTGCISFAFNPTANGRMVNQVISMCIIREAIELHRLRPFKVPSKFMVSNVLTKNESGPDYKRQCAMLIGATVWESLAGAKLTFKPTWCKFCSSSDTESQFDTDNQQWIATCNLCGFVVR